MTALILNYSNLKNFDAHTFKILILMSKIHSITFNLYPTKFKIKQVTFLLSLGI